jgi:hypothetical protein
MDKAKGNLVARVCKPHLVRQRETEMCMLDDNLLR